MGSQGSSGLWKTLEYVCMPIFKREEEVFKYVQGARYQKSLYYTHMTIRNKNQFILN